MMTTSTNPNCGAYLAAAQPSLIIDRPPARVKRCANPRCINLARAGFTRCEQCATYARELKRAQRAAAPPPARHWRDTGASAPPTIADACSWSCPAPSGFVRAPARRGWPVGVNRRHRRDHHALSSAPGAGTARVPIRPARKYCRQQCVQAAYEARKAAAA